MEKRTVKLSGFPALMVGGASCAMMLIYTVLAIAPTVGIIWIIVHFARKFW